jgi:transcriptional regulator with XRE-family HTH domain
MKQFRSRLKELRKKNGFSQKELAERLSLSRPTITAYESGIRTPPVETIINIADIFEVSIDYLLGRVDEPSYNQRSDNIFGPLIEKLQDHILGMNFGSEENEVIAKHIELSLKQMEAWLSRIKK